MLEQMILSCAQMPELRKPPTNPPSRTHSLLETTKRILQDTYKKGFTLHIQKVYPTIHLKPKQHPPQMLSEMRGETQFTLTTRDSNPSTSIQFFQTSTHTPTSEATSASSLISRLYLRYTDSEMTVLMLPCSARKPTKHFFQRGLQERQRLIKTQNSTKILANLQPCGHTASQN